MLNVCGRAIAVATIRDGDAEHKKHAQAYLPKGGRQKYHNLALLLAFGN
ncbi:MAG: hypothetical protein N2235_10370 [Fischerella sp.]|nr:hypothetical protein [Fischerella sp.]